MYYVYIYTLCIMYYVYIYILCIMYIYIYYVLCIMYIYIYYVLCIMYIYILCIMYTMYYVYNIYIYIIHFILCTVHMGAFDGATEHVSCIVVQQRANHSSAGTASVKYIVASGFSTALQLTE